MADFTGANNFAGLDAAMRDPAFLASLQNTLTPAGLMTMTMMEAENQRQAKALATQTAAASSAATAAGTQYQQAAAAPPPMLDPLAQSLPQLLGNVAGIVSGDNRYADRASRGIAGMQADLMTARVQNLQALKDGWDTKARAAENAGNLELSLTFRAKSEQLAKTLDMVMQKQQNADTLNRDKIQHGYRLSEIAAMDRGKNLSGLVAEPGSVENWANKLEAGQVKVTDIPMRSRTAVIDLLANRGSTILPQKVRDTITSVSAARGIIEELTRLSGEVNQSGPGVARFKHGAKSTVSGIMQQNENDALFDKTREGFLATISRATGERGVLTDRDVFRARQLLPSRFDSRLIAEKKIKQLNEFMDGMQARAMTAYTTANPLGGGNADPLGIRGK